MVEYAPLAELYRNIQLVRSEYHLAAKLHFNEISGQRWGNFDVGTRRVVELGVDALKHKSPSIHSKPPCCKIAVMFYPKTRRLSSFGGSDRKERELRYDETVMRILLKGALHYLYSPSDKITVRGIISDGEPNHRRLDVRRAATKILFDGLEGKTSLRDYAGFSSQFAIKHLRSDHRLYKCNTPDYIHANLLQLTDLMFGSIIRSCFGEMLSAIRVPRLNTAGHNKKDIIASPVREMLKKRSRGPGFQYSSHYQAFSVSRISLTADSIEFKNVDLQEKLIDDGSFKLFTD